MGRAPGREGTMATAGPVPPSPGQASSRALHPLRLRDLSCLCPLEDSAKLSQRKPRVRTEWPRWPRFLTARSALPQVGPRCDFSFRGVVQGHPVSSKLARARPSGECPGVGRDGQAGRTLWLEHEARRTGADDPAGCWARQEGRTREAPRGLRAHSQKWGDAPATEGAEGPAPQ